MSRSRALLALLAFVSTTILMAPPAMAQPPEMAVIEATAPLDNPSEEAVKVAIANAVRKAARGALAMGLPWLRIQNAYVRGDYVGVQVVAMKSRADDEKAPPADENATPPGPDAMPSPDEDAGPGETRGLRL